MMAMKNLIQFSNISFVIHPDEFAKHWLLTGGPTNICSLKYVLGLPPKYREIFFSTSVYENEH